MLILLPCSKVARFKAINTKIRNKEHMKYVDRMAKKWNMEWNMNWNMEWNMEWNLPSSNSWLYLHGQALALWFPPAKQKSQFLNLVVVLPGKMIIFEKFRRVRISSFFYYKIRRIVWLILHVLVMYINFYSKFINCCFNMTICKLATTK